MAKNRLAEFTVVKGIVPKTIKVQFKVFCIQTNIEMSELLETLIKQWVQTGAAVPQMCSNMGEEELEEIKGYIPASLKYQFKVLCKQKRVTMRFVLYALITQWVGGNRGNDYRPKSHLD